MYQLLHLSDLRVRSQVTTTSSRSREHYNRHTFSIISDKSPKNLFLLTTTYYRYYNSVLYVWNDSYQQGQSHFFLLPRLVSFFLDWLHFVPYFLSQLILFQLLLLGRRIILQLIVHNYTHTTSVKYYDVIDLLNTSYHMIVYHTRRRGAHTLTLLSSTTIAC